MFRPIRLLSLAAALAAAAPGLASAGTPQDVLATYRAQAGGVPFSAARGRQFYSTKGTDWSCSTCHTADPRQLGRHAVTGKAIAAFAPSTNPERFTDPAKVEKWFRRNCNDVLGRACTAVERGDVLTYVLSLPGGGAP